MVGCTKQTECDTSLGSFGRNSVVTNRLLNTEFPDIRLARVSAGTRYLVTMRLPRSLDALAYPQQLQYRRAGVVMATAPVVQVRTWLEELVHLAAHEARHVAQFRHNLRKSEIDAELWAARAVERFGRSLLVTAGA